MDLLTKCESLLVELEDLADRAKEMNEHLTHIQDMEYWMIEDLLAKQFTVVMQMSACYDDLMDYIDQLKEEEGMRFHANRIEKAANNVQVMEVE